MKRKNRNKKKGVVVRKLSYASSLTFPVHKVLELAELCSVVGQPQRSLEPQTLVRIRAELLLKNTPDD